MPDRTPEQTLEDLNRTLRRHLNTYAFTAVDHGGVFTGNQGEKWTEYEVSLLIGILAAAPQGVRALLAQVIAVPTLFYSEEELEHV